MGLLEPHGRGRRPFRRARLSRDPIIIVHSLDHAVAALEAAAAAGREVVIASAPAAALYAGAMWFGALVEAASAAVPAARFTALFDCGEDAGAAMAAIRTGISGIVFTGRADVARRLAAIAAQGGAILLAERPAAALDLGDWFFADRATLRRRCAEILASSAAFC